MSAVRLLPLAPAGDVQDERDVSVAECQIGSGHEEASFFLLDKHPKKIPRLL